MYRVRLQIQVVGNAVLVKIGGASTFVDWSIFRRSRATVALVHDAILVSVISNEKPFFWVLNTWLAICLSNANSQTGLCRCNQVVVTWTRIQTRFLSSQNSKRCTGIKTGRKIHVKAHLDRNCEGSNRRSLGLMRMIRCQRRGENICILSVFRHVIHLAIGPVVVGCSFCVCKVC